MLRKRFQARSELGRPGVRHRWLYMPQVSPPPLRAPTVYARRGGRQPLSEANLGASCPGRALFTESAQRDGRSDRCRLFAALRVESGADPRSCVGSPSGSLLLSPAPSPGLPRVAEVLAVDEPARERGQPLEAGPVSDFVEATAGFEPAIRVLQTPALTTWLRRQAFFGAEEGI